MDAVTRALDELNSDMLRFAASVEGKTLLLVLLGTALVLLAQNPRLFFLFLVPLGWALFGWFYLLPELPSSASTLVVRSILTALAALLLVGLWFGGRFGFSLLGEWLCMRTLERLEVSARLVGSDGWVRFLCLTRGLSSESVEALQVLVEDLASSHALLPVELTPLVRAARSL